MARVSRLCLLALALALAACAEEPEPALDAGVAPDAGRDDAGWIEWPDAGALPDAGGPGDAGVAADAGEGDAAVVTPPVDEYWANTQWPPYATLGPSETVPAFGQVWIPGRTEAAGAAPGLVAEVGSGPVGSDPAAGGWSWTPARFNVEAGNNDEFVADLPAPASGARDFAFRYRLEGHHWKGRGEWLYASLAGPDYQSRDAGKLAVREPGAELRVATLNLECLRDDPTARLQAAAARFKALGVDAVALQEACEDLSAQPAFTHSAEYLAGLLSSPGREFRAFFEQTHLANDTVPEGLGLVTALPVAQISVLELPTADFPRKALTALLASPVGMVAMTSTHFSFAYDAAATRLQQAQALAAAADAVQGRDQPAGTVVVTAGDFNAAPTEPAIATMQAGFTDAWDTLHPGEPGLTHPASNPTRRIDYVFVRGPAGATVSLAESLVEFGEPYTGSSHVSDHRGVSARFSIAP